MGKTLPALCTACGGDLILDGTPNQDELVARAQEKNRIAIDGNSHGADRTRFWFPDFPVDEMQNSA